MEKKKKNHGALGHDALGDNTWAMLALINSCGIHRTGFLSGG